MLAIASTKRIDINVHNAQIFREFITTTSKRRIKRKKDLCLIFLLKFLALCRSRRFFCFIHYILSHIRSVVVCKTIQREREREREREIKRSGSNALGKEGFIEDVVVVADE
jgi:hypothetical protein